MPDRATSPSRKPFHSDIIPLDLQAELINIREAQTHEYFRIGDIAAELVAKFATGEGRLYETQEVQAAVAYFVGKSARTVRYYQAVCEKIPADLREELAPYPLAWAHYAFASRFPGEELEILNWAVDNLASVDRLKAQFGSGEPPPERDTPPPVRMEYRTATELVDGFQVHLLRHLTRPEQAGQRKQVRALVKELRALLK